MSLRRPQGEFYGEIIRSTRANGLSLTEAVYSPGFRTPWHSHEHSYFCFILSGVSIQSYGKRTRRLQPFMSYFCPAGEAHCERLDKGPGREFIIGFDSAWFDRVGDHVPIHDVSVEFDGGMPAWLARRAYDEFLLADSVSPLAIEGLALELLAAISRRCLGASAQMPPRWLAAAKEILHEHFAKAITLGDIALAVKVHPVHLAREFRKWYRCSVGEYVRRTRIEYARDAIIKSDSPLIEIAYNAGFSDHSHFTRTFKRLTGLTPAEFRATKKLR